MRKGLFHSLQRVIPPVPVTRRARTGHERNLNQGFVLSCVGDPDSRLWARLPTKPYVTTAALMSAQDTSPGWMSSRSASRYG